MRWPWQKPETREAIGGYTAIISRLIDAQAAGTTQIASATAATEAVAGLLSRSLAAAMVEGQGDVAGIVTPRVLGQMGRDLIRVGESLHVLRYMGGRLLLIPASTWLLGGRRGPGDVALHGDRLRAVRIVDVAGSAIECRVRDLGLAYRAALSRVIAFVVGRRHGTAEREHRAVPGR